MFTHNSERAPSDYCIYVSTILLRTLSTFWWTAYTVTHSDAMYSFTDKID